MDHPGILRFEEKYCERVWGGDRLRTLYGKDLPPDFPAGEAWMISDHLTHESVVAEGPSEGQTLRQLLEHDPAAILGSRAKLTPHGRFPLLLKLLDAREVLSVQVHPDDDCAKRLGEPDAGKTEMWHVLYAEPGSELITGLDPSVSREVLAQAVEKGEIEQLMTRTAVSEGSSVFVPAGCVHAIGAGIVLAEIQQNSDLTYRLYDWQRLGADGKPRALHLDKAMEAIQYGKEGGGETHPLQYSRGPRDVAILSACEYFAAECVTVTKGYDWALNGDSFHIILVKQGRLTFSDDVAQHTLRPGEAALIPGNMLRVEVAGPGIFLDYYVPDLKYDIIYTLLDAGYSLSDLAKLRACERM